MKRSKGRATDRGRFERILFSFMGPPQLGGGPSTAPSEDATARCHRCDQPWEDHERVSTRSMTYARCP